MTAYCTSQQAIDWLGPSNAQDPYRSLAAVDPDTDSLALNNHGLRTGDPFEVSALGGTVAGGLALGVEYYAIVLTPTRWQVAATPADAAAAIAIDITDAGENMGVILRIPWDRFIAEEGAHLDDKFVGNIMPVPDGEPVPPIVTRHASLAVAIRAARFTGQTATDLVEQHKTSLAELDRYMAGRPIRNQPTPAANTAVSGPRLSGSAAEPRGWRRAVGGVEVL